MKSAMEQVAHTKEAEMNALKIGWQKKVTELLDEVINAMIVETIDQCLLIILSLITKAVPVD